MCRNHNAPRSWRRWPVAFSSWAAPCELLPVQTEMHFRKQETNSCDSRQLCWDIKNICKKQAKGSFIQIGVMWVCIAYLMKHIVEEWIVPHADRKRDDLKIFKTNVFTSSILGILPLSAVDAYSREHWQLKANFKWLESLFLPSKLMCRFSKHSSKIPPVFPDWISSRRDPMCAKAHDKCNLSIWT